MTRVEFVDSTARLNTTAECPGCLELVDAQGTCPACGEESDPTVPRDLETILDDLIRQARISRATRWPWRGLNMRHTQRPTPGSQRGYGGGTAVPRCTHHGDGYCTTSGAHISVSCRCGAHGVICPQRKRICWERD